MSVGTVRTTSFEQQYICALMSDMWVCFQQSNQQLAPQSKPCRTYLITFKHIFKSSTEPSACIRNFWNWGGQNVHPSFHPTTEFALLASNTWLWSVVVHCFKDWLNSSIFFAWRWCLREPSWFKYQIQGWTWDSNNRNFQSLYLLSIC